MPASSPALSEVEQSCATRRRAGTRKITASQVVTGAPVSVAVHRRPASGCAKSSICRNKSCCALPKGFQHCASTRASSFRSAVGDTVTTMPPPPHGSLHEYVMFAEAANPVSEIVGRHNQRQGARASNRPARRACFSCLPTDVHNLLTPSISGSAGRKKLRCSRRPPQLPCRASNFNRKFRPNCCRMLENRTWCGPEFQNAAQCCQTRVAHHVCRYKGRVHRPCASTSSVFIRRWAARRKARTVIEIH